MRSFLTFLATFTLLFFLAPILCLSAPTKKSESAAKPLPNRIPCDGTEVLTADLLIGRLALWDLRGYHPEALKAAAVAAATEIKNRYDETGTGDGIEFLTAEESKKAWGDHWFSVYWPEFRQAVSDTWGQTLSEAGNAPVFPLSWGQTAEGIPCPYDFTANGYESECSIPIESFAELFPDYKTSLTVKKSQSNRVESVTSGYTIRSGAEVAAEFQLPSLCFSITVEENRVVFLCYGKGNGEGMSLYAANESAKRGIKYEEILKTFYPDSILHHGSNRS